jgi:hypothetical protein
VKTPIARGPVLVVLALLIGYIPARAQWPAESFVARFQAKPDQTPQSYRARRKLTAENLRYKKAGWLEVLTEFEAGRMRYTVTARGGSELIHKKVLLPALEAERELLREGIETVALTPANYRFESAGPDERGLDRIRLIPLRADRRLVDGFLFVTPDADLVEISGRLAKSPSFWTKSVTITRRYRWIGEVRVPLSVTSVADIRFAGRSTFSMIYDFELVDGVRVAR